MVCAAPDLVATGGVGPDARRWCALAVASLVIAGLLSLAVVLGRLPILSGLIADPLFFKRCLVVHVDLSLLVWFYAFIGGLMSLRNRSGDTWAGGLGTSAAVVGVGAMLSGALVRGAEPVLANYVPVIAHPLFLGGLALFFAGVMFHLLASLWGQPRRQGLLPEAAAIGVESAAVAIVLAGVTWLAAVAGLPAGVDRWTYFEFSAWAAGHVLQVANICAMLAVWLWAVGRATGSPLLTRGRAAVLFAILLVPHFVMPLLTLRGTLDSLYHSGATRLMRWAIFPVVTIVALGTLRHLWRHRERNAAPPSAEARALRAGLTASIGLTLLGFLLGACIRGSNTLVPAHYHASLGGVTVAFMMGAYLIAAAVSAGRGRVPRFWAAARRQLGLFGIGQAVFALGFALGGAYGLGRKAYAAEQHVRTVGEYSGLIVMGVGGLVAVAGGLWFLFLILREMRAWWGRAS